MPWSECTPDQQKLYRLFFMPRWNKRCCFAGRLYFFRLRKAQNKAQIEMKKGLRFRKPLILLVEISGIEPLTSWMPLNFENDYNSVIKRILPVSAFCFCEHIYAGFRHRFSVVRHKVRHNFFMPWNYRLIFLLAGHTAFSFCASMPSWYRVSGAISISPSFHTTVP